MEKIDDILSKCLVCKNVCIDSRKAEHGDFFVALQGKNRNGNQYAKDAIEKGAKYALIDQEEYKLGDQYILVENALETLQNMARRHRESLSQLDCIAIVGSNGKTTTKELLYAVLSKKYNTYSTIGNLNNHIGVPINILKCTKKTNIAIIEMGANHCGEHALLCQIAKPNYGIITNCGKDHLEGYGSPEGVIQSNNELFDYLNKNNGHAFVNVDDDLLVRLSSQLSRTFYGFSPHLNNTQSQISITKYQPKLELAISDGKYTWELKSNLYGTFHASNIAAAVSIGAYFNVGFESMVDAIEKYVPQNNRSQIMDWNGNTVLLDAYNANPSSVLGMIEYFNDLKEDRKILILGDMAELGESSFNEHKAIIQRLKLVSNIQLILVGKEYKPFIEELSCLYFETTSELNTFIQQKFPFNKSTILVKGSRRHFLESLFTI